MLPVNERVCFFFLAAFLAKRNGHGRFDTPNQLTTIAALSPGEPIIAKPLVTDRAIHRGYITLHTVAMAKRLLLLELLAAALISAVIARSASPTPDHTPTPGAGERAHHRQHSAHSDHHKRHHQEESIAQSTLSEDGVKIGEHSQAHHRLRHHGARHAPLNHEKLDEHQRSNEEELVQGDSMAPDPTQGYTHGEPAHGNHSDTGEDHDSSAHGIHVASWRWDELGIYFTFTLFIIIAGLAKVGKLLRFFLKDAQL